VSLTINCYQYPEELWAAFNHQWIESGGTALVPAEYSAGQLLASNQQQTFWGPRRIITYRQLWSWVAEQLPEIPAPLANDLRPSLLGPLIKDQQLLSPLLTAPGGLAALSAHLERIEEALDRHFQPADQLQQEVEALRQKLRQGGYLLVNAQRSALARQAKNLDYPQPLLVTPVTWISRQLAGLFKGLSRQGEISIYLLAGPQMAEQLLSNADLLAAGQINHYPAEAEQRRRPATALFSGQAPSNAAGRDDREIEVRMIVADDQAEAAIAGAQELLAAGRDPQSIAILAPDPPRYRRALREAGVELGVPLAWFEFSSAAETSIGRLFLALARGDQDIETLKQLLPTEWAASEERWQQAVAEPDLQAWAALGVELLLGQDSGPDRGWFQRFAVTAEQFKAAGVEPWDYQELLNNIRSRRQKRGAGVAIVDPVEGARAPFSDLIILGLTAGQFPSAPELGPFNNPEIAAQYPELSPPDQQLLFSILALSPSKSLTLIRPSGSEPSAYWQEAARIWPEALGAGSAVSNRPRQRLRRAASQQSTAHDLLRQARQRLGGQRLAADNIPTRFSVTELERYQQCPLGWYVGKFFAPRPEKSKNRDQGQALHEILEQLYDLDPQERLDAVDDLLTGQDQQLFPGPERQQQADNLRWIVSNFSPPAWPFELYAVEQELTLETEADGELLTIIGRADRLDQDAEGRLLIIDYKRSGAYGQLQKVLYPELAAATFQLPVAGFAYLSINQRRLQLTSNVFPENIPAELLTDYQPMDKVRHKALEQAGAAIEGIRSGQWFTIGNNCPPWCQHRLLSRSGQ